MAEAFDALNLNHHQLRRSAKTCLNCLLHGRQVESKRAHRRRPQLLQLPRGATGALVAGDRSAAAGASSQAAESR
jgi:hypothetical protein